MGFALDTLNFLCYTILKLIKNLHLQLSYLTLSINEATELLIKS